MQGVEVTEPTIDQAIAILERHSLITKAILEQMATAAISIGDHDVAAEFTAKASDLGIIVPQIKKLRAIEDEAAKLPPLSRNPSAEERGIRLVYLETLKMLETIRMLQNKLGDGRGSQAAAQVHAVTVKLIGRVRHLATLAVDDLAVID